MIVFKSIGAILLIVLAVLLFLLAVLLFLLVTPFAFVWRLVESAKPILLIVLAVLLFLLVTPFAFVWRLVESAKHKKLQTGIASYFTEIAASFDQLGNATFGGFFTWLFLVKNKVKKYNFGDKDETISEVLGWNEGLGSLSKVGKSVVWLLDKVDKNHCKKARENGIEKAYQKTAYYQRLIKNKNMLFKNI